MKFLNNALTLVCQVLRAFTATRDPASVTDCPCPQVTFYLRQLEISSSFKTDIFEEGSWWAILQSCFPFWKQLLELVFAQNLKDIFLSCSVLVRWEMRRGLHWAETSHVKSSVAEDWKHECILAVVWMLIFYPDLYAEIIMSKLIVRGSGIFKKKCLNGWK